MQSQPLQNLGATVNLWLFCSSTGFSRKPAGFLVFSDALSILEVHKSNQKLYLIRSGREPRILYCLSSGQFWTNWLRISFSFLQLWVLEVRISNLENLEMPRGNRLSLQTGELDKTVIFLLLTLTVLCDNDAIVEIELPVSDTLPMSAESSGSNSRSAGIVREDDVCWLHVVFRVKTAGGPGGGVTTWYQGVMPPRSSRRRRQNKDETQDPTQGQSERGSSTPRGQNEARSERFARSAQEIGRPEKAGPSDPEKMYGIERLKKLEATVFEGSTDLADAKKEAEGWWKSIIARRNDARTLDWQTFRGIFEEKYYPTTYCEAKRDEFLELKQGSLSMAEYERKYTELSRYAGMIMASESDRCHRFERGLRFEIRTPVTAIAKWTNFSQLVETALRVEQSIVEEKSAMELSRGVSTTSGIRGPEQRRFTSGVNVSGCQDFKRRSGGKPFRQMSSVWTNRTFQEGLSIAESSSSEGPGS
ncbi:uncharacterized protein E5676_scaffold808G001020 [Cucumis melo var. makuwa]|uniref:Retrotransposon gag domain-containing protein n=1 Tax=Cucumis melo var. makuwa TaxID=1194695 RepID=A0A5D3BSA6_CUCMM|nr:uncharacterized protein E6C27_scaffold277G001260 [Cucumis melo var. makuwa]TYK01990.1 uncharacterized protein E5676_scaffold808G001020 [Cucumis melo var. makuwa]